MTEFTFPSIARPNMRYRMYESSQDNPASGHYGVSRGNPISEYISSFDTMNDGEVQHAPDYLPQVDQIDDFLHSLLAAIHTHRDGLPVGFDYVFNVHRGEASCDMVRFAKKLKRKPGETLYINLSDLKKSGSFERRHDKRWIAVDSDYMVGGTFEAVMCVLCQQESPCKPYSFLQSMGLYESLVKADCGFDIWDVAREIKKGDLFSRMEDRDIREMFQRFLWLSEYARAMRVVKTTREVSERTADRAFCVPEGCAVS